MMSDISSDKKSAQKCRVWLGANQQGFVYPELRPGNLGSTELLSKCNVGVAISGGGLRAASLGIGWLRGLYELGLLQDIRYLSTVSGGSWAATLLFLLPVDSKDPNNSRDIDAQCDTYLGKFLYPEQCSLEKLEALDPQCHAASIADVNFVSSAFRERFIRARDKMVPLTIQQQKRKESCDFWSQAVQKTFFVRRDSDARKDKTASPLTSKLPFLIVNASVEVGGSTGYAPLDFTPLYFGTSFLLDIAVVFEIGSSCYFLGVPNCCCFYCLKFKMI
jgi:hypothetical protein